MTNTVENTAAEAATVGFKEVTFTESMVRLQIGRTGEKAKFQGRMVEIDLAKLPVESIAFALQYGLKQYIADGTAGSEDQAGYDLGIDQRIRKLAEADFKRATGERAPKADTPERRAFKMATDAIKAKLKAAGQDATADKVKAAAAKMVESQPQWLAKAKAAIEAERKLAEEMDLGDVGLDDLLGLTDEA